MLILLIFNSSFVFVYSEDLSNYSNSESVKALEIVRDGMWDLAVKVYLYETVLFEPDKYFNFDLDGSGREDINSTIDIQIPDNSVWSVPIGPSGVNDINFIPAQLFDITFVVSDGGIYGISDILAVVTFENFGTEIIPVNLTYTLFDSNNEIIFVDSDSEVVESAKSLVRDFKNQDSILIVGSYKLVLETIYGDNVRDSFIANFDVVEKSGPFFSGLILYLFGFILFLVISFIFLFIYRTYFTKSDDVENFDDVSSKLNQNLNVEQPNSNTLVNPISNTAATNNVITDTISKVENSGVGVSSADTLDKQVLNSTKESKKFNDFDIEGGDNLIDDDF